MLGALAIISAILLVVADRNERTQTPIQQTVTDTVEPDAPEPDAPDGGPPP